MDPSNVRGAKKIEYEVVACGPMTVEIKDDDGDVFDTEELDGEYVTLEPRYNTWDTFRTLNIRKEKFLDNFKKKCMSTAHMAQGLTEDTVVIFEPDFFLWNRIRDTAANALYVAWTRGSKKTYICTDPIPGSIEVGKNGVVDVRDESFINLDKLREILEEAKKPVDTPDGQVWDSFAKKYVVDNQADVDERRLELDQREAKKYICDFGRH